MSVESGHDMKCGHSEPSNKETSLTAKSVYPFVNDYKLKLFDDDSAEIIIGENIYV